MVDVHTKQQRSYNMSRIKGRNTKPEITLRKFLSFHGLKGYRTHYPLTGKPDIAFPKQKIAIFVDGCFWHKCPVCRKIPATNTKFWTDKINSNVRRDRIVNAALRKKGWKVIRIREHVVTKNMNKCLAKILQYFGNK